MRILDIIECSENSNVYSDHFRQVARILGYLQSPVQEIIVDRRTMKAHAESVFHHQVIMSPTILTDYILTNNGVSIPVNVLADIKTSNAFFSQKLEVSVGINDNNSNMAFIIFRNPKKTSMAVEIKQTLPTAYSQYHHCKWELYEIGFINQVVNFYHTIEINSVSNSIKMWLF
jgi:hypothetical protein